MIDVHARPVAAPFQMGHGQRTSLTAFSRFLESSAPNRSDEPAGAMRPSREETPLRCTDELSLQNDGCNEQDVRLAVDGWLDVDATADGGGTDLQLGDEGAWSSITPVDEANRLAEPQHGGGGKAWDFAIGSNEVTSAQDAQPLQMQAAGGSEEWIFRPWRLHAGSGLSYRGGIGLPCSMGGSGAVFMALRADAGQGGGVSMDVAGEHASPALRERQPVPLVHGDTVLRSGRGDGADPSDPIAAGGREKVAWAHWAQRMLRWNAGAMGDESATAWVRDFFLEADEMLSLVASLQAFSAGQGISLGRIMINGREAWAAAGYSQHMERGRDGR